MKKFILALVLLNTAVFSSGYEEAWEARKNGDYKKAMELYQKACDDNDAKSCNKLGLLYKTGKNTKPNNKKADELYNKANELFKKDCNNGDAFACFFLGGAYKNGQEGLEQNKTMAKDYYGRACDLDHQLSCEYYQDLH